MSPTLRQFAPVGCLAAVAIWCCWGYLAGDKEFTFDQQSKLPRISSTELRPKLGARTARDPFQPAQPRPSVPALSMLEAAAPAEPAPAIDLSAMASQLHLEATYVDHHRQLAVINGQVYEVNDRIPLGNPDVPSRLMKIHSESVIVQLDGQSFRIGYPTFAGPTSPRSLTQPNAGESRATNSAAGGGIWQLLAIGKRFLSEPQSVNEDKAGANRPYTNTRSANTPGSPTQLGESPTRVPGEEPLGPPLMAPPGPPPFPGEQGAELSPFIPRSFELPSP